MKNKGKKILIGYLVIVMVILSSLHTPLLIKVKADSNYSNYLTSESISVENDKALILYENSGSGNNYRNYYETGFLFPSKLRTDMYSTDLTTNPAKYYFQQTYLKDLDNDYAFDDVENLGQYQTNDFVGNYSDITESNGYYNNTEYSYEIEILPNQDILNEWHHPIGTHYNTIDENYTTYNYNDYIQASSSEPNEIERFGLENISLYLDKVVNITVYIHSQGYDNLFVYLSNNETDIRSFQLIEGGIIPGGKWNIINFTNLDLSIIEFNNLEIILKSDISVIGITNVQSLFLEVFCYSSNILELNDYNYYNYISEGADNSFVDNFNDNDIDDNWITFNGGGSMVEQNQRLEMTISNGNGNWYPVDYNCPKMYIDNNMISNWNLSVDLVNTMNLYHFSGLALFDDNANGYMITTLNDGANRMLCRKIISGVGTTLLQTTILAKYLKIEKENNIYYFKYSIDDITYSTAYSTSSLGISGSYVGFFHASWSTASSQTQYFDNFEFIGSQSKLNISSELQIETEGNSYDNLESLELEYTLKANSTCDFDLYLYNINSEIYDLVATESITTSFQEFSYSYALNYSYYNTLGFTNFTFYFENSFDLLISIDKINLKATFSNFSLNNEGYHNIGISFNRKTSVGVNRGNISLELQLYKTYFTYDYIENNVIESDYSKMNQMINFSNELLEPIIECEIQAHIRFGLNTLDIDIVNVYYQIILNYNYTYEIFEQLRFGNNDGNYFRYEFSYDAYNFNRLNNTGIFGNYSMNCLSGLRVLRGTTAINYNRYFLIPYFDEKISLTYSSPLSESGSSSEPRLPSGKYWTYETFQLAEYGITGITVENWTVDFTTVEAEKYEAKFFYKEKSIKRRDLGDWRFKIGDIKISFNFIRNALTDILNLIFLFFQYLFFLVTASLSYIFMYLGVNIMVLIWNVLVYYIFIALIWILWFLYSALYFLFLMLYALALWLYEVVLIPFMNWLWEVAIPWIIDFLIIILAHIITIVIWLITLGEADYDTIYDNVYKMLRYIVDEIIEMLTVFVYHLDYVLLFILYYLLLTGMLYMRYIYCKARGFNNRAKQLHSAFEVFIIPILFTLYLFKTTKDLVDPYTS